MPPPDRRPRLAFSWSGLPQYAAWLMRAAIGAHGARCTVVGTRPGVPIDGMEEVLGQSIAWVDKDAAPTWQELGEPVPEVFVQSGWAAPAFNALGREVRAAGGSVILLADFCWRGDFRQRVLGPIGYRLRHRAAFDGVLVAGASGVRVARYFGVPPARIRIGMLGAEHGIFAGGGPLAARPPEFLFVGRMIELKAVRQLADAFIRVAATRPEIVLRLCGSGPLAEALPRHPRIVVESFVQPRDLVARYRQARFLVLPSFRDAWGLVVHEAALSGCALILSDAVGSIDDLATAANALRVRPGDVASLADALDRAAGWDAARLDRAEAESRRLAAQFGPERFAVELLGLVEIVRRVRRT